MISVIFIKKAYDLFCQATNCYNSYNSLLSLAKKRKTFQLKTVTYKNKRSKDDNFRKYNNVLWAKSPI